MSSSWDTDAKKEFRSILGGLVSVQLNINYWASEMAQCIETPAVPTQGPEFGPWWGKN